MAQRDRGRSTETERYERAATDALTLLDWCIRFFADNGEGQIAAQLAQNRRHIGERMKNG